MDRRSGRGGGDSPGLECALADLCGVAEALGHPMAGERAEVVGAWARLVAEWASSAQLTSVVGAAGVVRELMEPALYALPHLPKDGGLRIVDLGCGSGSTAVALWGAVGAGRWSLIDRATKKITFCRYALGRCRIEGVVAMAPEEWDGAGDKADVVLARALPRTPETHQAILRASAPGATVITWAHGKPGPGSLGYTRCGDADLYAVASRADVSRETIG